MVGKKGDQVFAMEEVAGECDAEWRVFDSWNTRVRVDSISEILLPLPSCYFPSGQRRDGRTNTTLGNMSRSGVCARATRGDEYCNTLPRVYGEPRALTTRRAGQVIGPIYRSNDILVQTWLGTERKNNLKCVTLFFLFLFSDSCNGRVELSTIVPPSFFTGSKSQML